MLTIFVVSDATGETAERVVRSALVQFEGPEVQVVRRGGMIGRETTARSSTPLRDEQSHKLGGYLGQCWR